MKLIQHDITITTSGRGTQNITDKIIECVEKSTIETGLCQLFLQHTSASLIICENYDPQVREDLENFLLRLIPDGDPLFKHTIEGEDDMPAHIRTILTQTSITIPIQAFTLALGTWQGIYFYEHRYQAQKRKLLVSIWGE
jgi:secondary thiamine-phosphate synthase enzyme